MKEGISIVLNLKKQVKMSLRKHLDVYVEKAEGKIPI